MIPAPWLAEDTHEAYGGSGSLSGLPVPPACPGSLPHSPPFLWVLLVVLACEVAAQFS